MDDQTAIRHLKDGDIGGLDVLVKRYQVQAVRTAYLILQDQAMAEDVMQSAFIRVYDRIHQFNDQYPFKPWFMRIVVNMALKASGSDRTVLTLDMTATDFLTDATPNPELQLEEAQQEAVVREALAALSAEQRAVIVMRYYLDYTESEIAQAVQAPLGTVRWRMHAAKKRLRGLLTAFQPGYAGRMRDE